MATNVKVLSPFILTNLTTTAVDLYAPPSPRTALVSSIQLTAGAGTPTVVLKAVAAAGGANTAIFHRATLSATIPSVVDGPITIGPGDKLTIQSASGTVNVKAVVLGIERD